MSRAEYMKEIRKNKKAFSVLLEKNRFEIIDEYLKGKNMSKKQWLESKIDEIEKQKNKGSVDV